MRWQQHNNDQLTIKLCGLCAVCAADVDGLRYYDTEQGRGKAIAAGDTVVVSWRLARREGLGASIECVRQHGGQWLTPLSYNRADMPSRVVCAHMTGTL